MNLLLFSNVYMAETESHELASFLSRQKLNLPVLVSVAICIMENHELQVD